MWYPFPCSAFYTLYTVLPLRYTQCNRFSSLRMSVVRPALCNALGCLEDQPGLRATKTLQCFLRAREAFLHRPGKVRSPARPSCNALRQSKDKGDAGLSCHAMLWDKLRSRQAFEPVKYVKCSSFNSRSGRVKKAQRCIKCDGRYARYRE